MKLLLANGAKIDVDTYGKHENGYVLTVVIQLLSKLKHIKKLFFDSGMTPLLAAAVTGHIHIVEYLISNKSLVSREERVDSLDLLGATFVDKKRDMLGCYKLWKRSLEDRLKFRLSFNTMVNLLSTIIVCL